MFFAIWAKYCAEMRIPSDEMDDARREFITAHFPEKSSMKELKTDEIGYLIHKIKEMIAPQEMPKEALQDGDKMRKKIIAILCEVYNFRKQRNEKTIPDMVRINEWLKAKTACKQDINGISITELPNVVTQLMKLQKNIQEANRKKMNVEGGNKC
jgi:hypothetical protein